MTNSNEIARNSYRKVCQLVVELRNNGVEGVTVVEENGRFVVKQGDSVIDVNTLASDSALRQKMEALNAAQAEYEQVNVQLADAVKTEIMNAVQQEWESTQKEETVKEKYTKVCQLVVELRNSGIEGVTVEEENGKFVVKKNGTVIDVNTLESDSVLRQKIEALNAAQAEYEQVNVQLEDSVKIEIMHAVALYTQVSLAEIALTSESGITVEWNNGAFVVKRNGEVVDTTSLVDTDPLKGKIEALNAAQQAYSLNGYQLNDIVKSEIKASVQSRADENQRKANELYANIQYIVGYINTKEGLNATIAEDGSIIIRGVNGETLSVTDLVTRNIISQAAVDKLNQAREGLNALDRTPENMDAIATEQANRVQADREMYSKVVHHRLYIQKLTGFEIQEKDGGFVVVKDGQEIPLSNFTHERIDSQLVQELANGYESYMRIGGLMSEQDKTSELEKQTQEASKTHLTQYYKWFEDAIYNKTYLELLTGYSISLDGGTATKANPNDPNNPIVIDLNQLSEELPASQREKLELAQRYYRLFKDTQMEEVGASPEECTTRMNAQMQRAKENIKADILNLYRTAAYNKTYLEQVTGYTISLKDGVATRTNPENPNEVTTISLDELRNQLSESLKIKLDRAKEAYSQLSFDGLLDRAGISQEELNTISASETERVNQDIEQSRTQSEHVAETLKNAADLQNRIEFETGLKVSPVLVDGEITGWTIQNGEETSTVDDLSGITQIPENVRNSLVEAYQNASCGYIGNGQLLTTEIVQEQVQERRETVAQTVAEEAYTKMWNCIASKATGWMLSADGKMLTKDGEEPKTIDAFFSEYPELAGRRAEYDAQLTVLQRTGIELNAETRQRIQNQNEVEPVPPLPERDNLGKASYIQNCMNILTGYSVLPIIDVNGDISGWSVKDSEGEERILTDANAVLHDVALREKLPTASLNALVTLYSEVATERKTAGTPLTQDQINDALNVQRPLAEQSVQQAKDARAKIEYIRAYVKEKHQINLVTQIDEATGEIKWGSQAVEGEQSMLTPLEDLVNQGLISADQAAVLTENTARIRALGVELDNRTVETIKAEQEQLAQEAILREQRGNNQAFTDALRKATVVHNGLQMLTGWSIMPVIENGQITGWTIKDAEGNDKTEADFMQIMPEANVQKLKALYADVARIAQETETPLTLDVVQAELPETQQDAQRVVETLKTSYQLMSYTQAVVKKKAQIDLQFTPEGITAKRADGTDVVLAELVSGNIITAEELASLQRNHATYYAQPFELDNKTAEAIKAEQIRRANEMGDDNHGNDDSEDEHDEETPEQRAMRRRHELMGKTRLTSQEKEELDRLNEERRRALEQRLVGGEELSPQEAQELAWLQRRAVAQQPTQSPRTSSTNSTSQRGGAGGGSGGGSGKSNGSSSAETSDDGTTNGIPVPAIKDKKGFLARNWEWIVGAVAAIAVAVGAFFLIRKQKKKTDKAKDEVNTLTGQVSDLQNKVNELSNGNSENSASSALANSGTAVNVDSLTDNKSARQLIYDSQTKSM